MNSALELAGISKTYPSGGRRLAVLSDVSLRVDGGEVVWLRGPSGAGKSTLLNIAGLLAFPDRGSVRLAGEETAGMRGGRLARMRARVGFVFQDHNLLAHLTSVENIMLASRADARTARKRAESMLDHLGLADRAGFPAAQLSGGEQKRIAVARALMNRPAVVLADEPTAGLDAEATGKVLGQLTAAAETGQAVLIASHDEIVASISDRSVALAGATLTGSGPTPTGADS